MKKYLMTGVAALAICAAFTSCSKSGDELYNPEAVSQMSKEKITETYNARFLAYVGGSIAPDQDWGFGTATRAFTRANGVGEVIKPDNGKDGIFEFTNDERNATGWRSPEGVAKYVAPITDAEREFVQAWFNDPAHAGLSDEGKEFNSFYVQQVYNKLYSADEDNKKGYFWESKNGVIEKTEKMYKVKMDQLRIGSARDEASTVHIKDFNATDNGFNAWNAIYVKDGSSKQFAYWASYGSQWQWKFRCVELTVPGTCFSDGQPRTGYYVGLSYYCDKVEIAGQKGEIIGEDEIDICNDWILKIVPGETIPTPPTREYTIRVLGEDLTFANSASGVAVTESDEGADFDFNDVVFDVAHVSGGTTDENGTWIRLMAAGGTLPLYIGSVAEANEVHNMFRVSQTTMVNTGHNAHKAKDPVEFRYSADQVNAKDIAIIVIKDGIQFELSAQKGEPASKIAVSNMNFDWADERQSIKKRYPLFVDWAQGGQKISDWWD